MAKITSVVGRISGNVAFKNQKNGIFHAQIEFDGVDSSWTIDAEQSQMVFNGISVNPSFENIVDVFNGFTFTGDPIDEVRDIAAAFYLRATADNGRHYNFDWVYEKGSWREIFNDKAVVEETITNADKLDAAIAELAGLLGGTPA